MSRITILAAGNSDVRDCLYALRENGSVTWNGINAVLRSRNADLTARVIHRTITRSDALLAMDGAIPLALLDQAVPKDPFSARSQYVSDVFTTCADVVVLSIQPDVMHALCRHRIQQHYFFPYDMGTWPTEARRWLTDDYAPVAMLEPDQSMRNLERVIARFRERQQAPILIFNMSAAMPWDRVHCYRGLGETLGERICRFNLALIGLSRSTGISIVDVDSIFANAGASGLKIDPVTLTAQGCRLVTQEVADILDDLGVLGPGDVT